MAYTIRSAIMKRGSRLRTLSGPPRTRIERYGSSAGGGVYILKSHGWVGKSLRLDTPKAVLNPLGFAWKGSMAFSFALDGLRGRRSRWRRKFVDCRSGSVRRV